MVIVQGGSPHVSLARRHTAVFCFAAAERVKLTDLGIGLNLTVRYLYKCLRREQVETLETTFFCLG